MKQIFDWMRKQPLKAFKVYDGSIGVYPCEVNRLIDEAEAKWEAECCEWKRCENSKHIIVSPHNPVFSQFDVSLKLTPYCPACGKKIKITEVIKK